MAQTVRSAELKRLMKASQGPTAATSQSRLKKYKLSSRAIQLMEEQRLEAQEDAQRMAPPRLVAAPPPQKGILKHVSRSPTAAPISTTMPPPAVPMARSDPTSHPEAAAQPTPEPEAGASGGDIPEGFFDDPFQDAKARHVEFKNPGDEEWDQFQKEISQEIRGAHELAQEDQAESTVDRQLDEIDEQMRAWHRVAALEKKLDAVEKKLEASKAAASLARPSGPDSDDDDDDDDESDEVDLTDLLDWRQKS